MEEIWKDISGYEGLYKVSDFGRIKKFRKIRNTPNGGIRIYCEKILVNIVSGGNYLSVKLCKNGTVKRFLGS